MANRKQKLDAAITESNQRVSEATARAPKKDASAPTTQGFVLNPKEQADAGVPVHRRARKDATKRQQEFSESTQTAKQEAAARQLDQAARAYQENHAARLTEIKKKFPNIQAIQEQEPITLEEARRQVAEKPQVVSPTYVKPKRVQPARVMKALKANAALKVAPVDESGIVKPASER